MTDSLKEYRTGGRQVFDGRLLKVWQDQVRLPNGAQAVREYVRHPGAAMIVPLLDVGAAADDDGCRLIVERQYRYPLDAVVLEFPAGKLDPGESTLFCAQRELREETGFSAARWARAGVLHPLVAYSTECIDIWFAQGLSAGGQQLDEAEFLEVTQITARQLFEACRNGQITDAKTLVGAFWLQALLRGQWQPDWQVV
ncbi:MAG: NUDIX hydrolase [Burkholderiaceae bacterium]|nr:NUDIX hydrolase [Burkholderiaceae bacterium]